MSLGPNIKICGGWADNPACGASIDVFETHFACLDIAGRHRWELVRSIYSLSKAIKWLPSYVQVTAVAFLSVDLNHLQMPYSQLQPCYQRCALHLYYF